MGLVDKMVEAARNTIVQGIIILDNTSLSHPQSWGDTRQSHLFCVCIPFVDIFIYNIYIYFLLIIPSLWIGSCRHGRGLHQTSGVAATGTPSTGDLRRDARQQTGSPGSGWSSTAGANDPHNTTKNQGKLHSMLHIVP